jgi:hypothetical protein
VGPNPHISALTSRCCDQTTPIPSRRPDDPRQHARQRRAVARCVVLAVPPSSDHERGPVARSRAGAVVRAAHGVHPVRRHRCRRATELMGAERRAEVQTHSPRLDLARMWGKADNLRLFVLMGLCKGLRLVCGMRRALTDDEQQKVAAAIVEHLESHNWKIEQGPAREGRGPGLIGSHRRRSR